MCFLLCVKKGFCRKCAWGRESKDGLTLTISGENCYLGDCKWEKIPTIYQVPGMNFYSITETHEIEKIILEIVSGCFASELPGGYRFYESYTSTIIRVVREATKNQVIPSRLILDRLRGMRQAGWIKKAGDSTREKRDAIWMITRDGEAHHAEWIQKRNELEAA